MNMNDRRVQVLGQTFWLSLSMRRMEITSMLLAQQGHKVLSGPFKGMTLIDDVAWGDGDLAPKLLGCYEQELHHVIQMAIQRNHSVVVNVGCAEGYYAVGLARLLPKVQVFAFDIEPKTHAICRNAAEINGVNDRVTVAGACTIEALSALVSRHGRVLLFVDCEGAEIQLLDPSKIPELNSCDIIVECHDFLNRAITKSLKERFAQTHNVEEIIEGGRDPNSLPCLRRMQSFDRWIAVNENRPETMNWLVCWSKCSPRDEKPTLPPPTITTLVIGEDYTTALGTCLSSKRDYAAKHGYTFIQGGEAFWDRTKPIAWSKIPFLLDVCSRLPEGAIIWQSDADVLITNAEFRLEEHLVPLLPEDKDLLMTLDAFGNINSGSILFRNTEWSRDYWRRVYRAGDQKEITHHVWWENFAMILLYNQNPLDFSKIAITREHKLFNAYLCGLDDEPLWVPGDFLVHFAGIRDPTQIEEYARRCKAGETVRVPVENQNFVNRAEFLAMINRK